MISSDSCKNAEVVFLQDFFNKTFNTLDAEDWFYIDFAHIKGMYKYDFPAQHGSWPKKVSSSNKPARFVVQRGYQSSPPASSKDEHWHVWYRSNIVTVWEDVTALKVVPAYLHIKEKDKKNIYSYILNTVSSQISGEKTQPVSNIPSVLKKQCNIALSFWVEGRCRGCAVVEGSHSLYENIETVVTRTYDDIRYPSVTKEELEDLDLHISFFSINPIITTNEEMTHLPLNTQNVYKVSTNSKDGWYTPVVFNTKAFRTSKHFFDSLFYEKTQLTVEDCVSVHAYSSNDFYINSQGHWQKMCGPVPVLDNYNHQSMIGQAVRWVCDNQAKNGSYPIMFSPFSGSTKISLDWTLTAHASMAMSLYALSTNNQQCQNSALEAFVFLDNNIKRLKRYENIDTFLTQVYFLRTALLLEDLQCFKKNYYELNEQVVRIYDAPIVLLNWYSLKLAALENSNLKEFINEESLVKDVRIFVDSFKEKISDPNTQPAEYAELLLVVRKLHKITADRYFKATDDYVTQWLESFITSDGAVMADRSGMMLPYARGTAKVLEALMYQNKTDKYSHVWKWLAQMQYSQYNTFTVDTAYQEKILGSIRETVSNTHPHLDAVAHILIAEAYRNNAKVLDSSISD